MNTLMLHIYRQRDRVEEREEREREGYGLTDREKER